MDSLRACMLYLLGCVKICNKCASPLPTWLRQIIANGFRCLFIIALWLHHFFLFFPPPDDQWSTAASITSGVFIWCRLWSGYQLGGEVINYPTLSIILRTICQASQLWKTALLTMWWPSPLHPLHPFIYHLLKYFIGQEYIHLLVNFPEKVVGAFRVIIIWR